jgi:tellurite resistance protein TerC
MNTPSMNVSLEVWVITAIIITAVIFIDLVFQLKRKGDPTFKESAIFTSIFLAAAIGFYFFVDQVWGQPYGSEYLAGFITEYSLSIDNLFIFLIIFTKLAVPERAKRQALTIGILIALALRFIFIAIGAVAISRFSWVFYLFGAFLIYTAYTLVRDHFKSHGHDEAPGGKFIDFIKRRVNVTEEYHGAKVSIKKNGKRYYTPLLFAMIAIGSADLLFALDSIPAVYGLTKEPYIVFTANAFALLGLRHLFFLLSGLLSRLVYLGIGLSVILAWIGVKLVIHALHENELPFINGGQHFEGLPEISTNTSLGVILVTITIATVASLIKTRVKK